MGMHVEGLQLLNNLVFSPQEQKVLLCLHESRQSVARFDCDPWQFALQMRDFEIQGISPTTIRCLVQRDLVAHGIEKTPLRSARRIVVPVSHLCFTEKSSFMLTDQGLALASSTCHSEEPATKGSPAADHAEPGPSLPSFVVCENGCRELRFGGKVAKRFNAYAERQETILQAFQEQGWVPWIADPLTSSPKQNPKIGLRDAIARLNRHQIRQLVRFHGDGTGRGIRWCPVAGHNKDATSTQQSDV
jgi:hypothetical protein